ncbi:Ribbon-helix-helix protein CopG domain-containing protein (plasmid) [Paraburkholderia kururiensis]|uniref:hypothetical protein n=1 Tax=Paraburkholderia kururiensis TaxID=984307 RepID=UPI0039A56D27
MTTPIVHFRITWDELERLKEDAQKRKLTFNAMARLYLRDAMAGYDRKHEVLMETNQALLAQVTAMQEAVTKLCILAAGALASSAIPPGLASTMPDSLKDQVRGHIREAIKQGKNIDRAYDNGTFEGD